MSRFSISLSSLPSPAWLISVLVFGGPAVSLCRHRISQSPLSAHRSSCPPGPMTLASVVPPIPEPSLIPVRAFRRYGIAGAKDSIVSEMIDRAVVKWRAASRSTGTPSVVFWNAPWGYAKCSLVNPLATSHSRNRRKSSSTCSAVSFA